jgi:tetratricopeptide (TPR) repeat protein
LKNKRWRVMGRTKITLMHILALTSVMIMPVWATGLGGSNPAPWAGNPAVAYCLNQGGSPQSGNCYFPDGSYCNIWAFYNRTCPSRSTIEQSMWNAEINAWLNSDEPYCPSCRFSGTSVPGPTAAYCLSEGDRLYKIGYYENAVDQYYRAVGIDPTLFDGWIKLAGALNFLGRYSEALAAYDSALSLQTTNSTAIQGRASTQSALMRTGSTPPATTSKGAPKAVTSGLMT